MRLSGPAAMVLLAAAFSVGLAGPSPAVASGTQACAGSRWVASWAASPTDSRVPTDATGAATPQALSDQSLRMIVTPHLGGTSLRIHLSNRFGTTPVTFGGVTVARRVLGPAVGPAAPVRFGGARSVTIPAGGEAVSDPAGLTFAAFDPLAVSIFVPGDQASPTKHWNANATSYYSPAGSGDRTGELTGPSYTGRTGSWLYVNGVDVLAPAPNRAVVAFGDSITDGFVASTALSVPADASVADRNLRYPDDLQRRLLGAGIPVSVVNAGISGNMLLTSGEPSQAGRSGLQRFDEDALTRAGVAGVLLLEGINDLGLTPATPEQVISGYTQLIDRAHAAGVKIWLGTITPASNAIIDGTGTAPDSENYRQQINSWIRGQRLADGFVDFDAAVRNPADPSTLLPAYASVDNLHPNPAGYRAMANAVDLRMIASAGCER
ncbi:GDSL-type esterase/lipase family protein [Frankia sp. Mgl5]|uniref:GDSL-type esterase/lipase family protein n=1 Tax=Frankia sp. Mgl5 TaxID=2933793 RepID=UPI00200C0B32|nr:GDSL-type esterase/lipase family protein [Frankia sp. Mgl5]MCK9929232.1 GDSL-type esterase/lipase family protein [Frankia sp. Mgl5]